MKLTNYLKRTNVQIGLRLFFASLFLACGHYVLAAIAMLFPMFSYNPFVLATGAVEIDEKALLDKIEKKIAKAMEDAAKDNISPEKLEKRLKKLNEEIGQLTNDSMKELNERMKKYADENEGILKELKEAKDALIEQSKAIKTLTEKGKVADDAKPKTFRQALEDAFMEKDGVVKMLSEKSDDYGKRLSLKDYFTDKGNKTTPVMTVKVAVDMLQSAIVGNNVSLLRLTQLDPQRVGIPLTIYPHVLDVFASKTITRPNMSLLVVYSYEDGAATKTEGTASAKSSFLLKTVEFKAFYIATHFILSDETLDDLNEVLDEISVVAPDKILDKIDGYILGSAGDDASAIAGILTATKNTAFAAASGIGAASVDKANTIDAIASAKLQCENNKYKPNAVYLNPVDVAILAATKNAMDDSRLDRRVQYDVLGNPVAVCGLRIIASTVIVANTFIVFDSQQPWIGKRADMTMEIGYNGTDLTEGQKTVVIKVRLAFGVRDKAAVIYCSDITAAVAAIEKP